MHSITSYIIAIAIYGSFFALLRHCRRRILRSQRDGLVSTTHHRRGRNG